MMFLRFAADAKGIRNPFKGPPRRMAAAQGIDPDGRQMCMRDADRMPKVTTG